MKVELEHLILWHFDTLGVLPPVELSPDAEPRRRAGGGDQLHDGCQTRQGPPAPVGAEVGEEPGFDLVPRAGARRKVANRDFQARRLGPPREFPFPEAHAGSVASPKRVGSLWVAFFRPAPGRRILLGSRTSPDASSLMPCPMVTSEIPVALATRAMPPRPRSRASVATPILRLRSVSVGAIALYLARIRLSKSILLDIGQEGG